MRLCYMALFLIFLLTTQARSNLIDQRWEQPQPYVSGGSGHSIYLNSPIGQEFTPTRDKMTAIELAISADVQNMPPGDTPPITITLRENAITDNIIETTSRVPELLDTTAFHWFRFDFDEAVSLVPGNRYVIEVSTLWAKVNWVWVGWQDTYGIGVPGRRIIDGIAQDSAHAFGFRTYSAPEPATLSLLSLSGFVLLRRRH